MRRYCLTLAAIRCCRSLATGTPTLEVRRVQLCAVAVVTTHGQPDIWVAHGTDFEAAEEAGKAAVVMCTQLYGEDHVDTATSMNNLAVIYLDQGDADRAVPMLEKCLAIRIAAYGSDHPE